VNREKKSLTRYFIRNFIANVENNACEVTVHSNWVVKYFIDSYFDSFYFKKSSAARTVWGVNCVMVIER